MNGGGRERRDEKGWRRRRGKAATKGGRVIGRARRDRGREAATRRCDGGCDERGKREEKGVCDGEWRRERYREGKMTPPPTLRHSPMERNTAAVREGNAAVAGEKGFTAAAFRARARTPGG